MAEAKPARLVSRRARDENGDLINLKTDIDPFMLALHDDVQSGWFNGDKRELAPGFPLSPSDIVADVGSGEGGMSRFCVRMGARVIMIDNDDEVMERAVRDAKAAGDGDAEGRPGAIEKLPLEDASVTRVLCCEVLEHVDDPAEALKELVRVGQPGALYLFTVPGAAAERLMKAVAPPEYFEKPNHVRIFEADQLAALIEEAGLEVQQRFSYGFFWTMYWLFFYQAEIEFGRDTHPLLDAWTRTWREVVDSSQAAMIRRALNELAPRSIGIVARKPG